MADTGTGSGDEPRLSPHRRRALAFLVDLVAATGGPVLLLAVGGLAVPGLTGSWWVVLVVAAACLGATSGLSTWLTGGLTLGKAVAGLSVRRVDGRAPGTSLGGLAWSLGRSSVGYVVVDVLGAGALLAFATARRRCLHDVVFGSEVVATGEHALRPTLELRGRDFVSRLQDGVEWSGSATAGCPGCGGGGAG